MTFDDGILTVYQTENIAEPGMKPVIGLKEKEKYYYGFGELGFNRVYTAMQAKQQIEAVVNVPGWNDIRSVHWMTGSISGFRWCSHQRMKTD